MKNINILNKYLEKYKDNLNTEAVAFYAAIESIAKVSPDIARAIVKELYDQNKYIKLIASENFSSLAVQLAQGNWFTDKYAEGYPGHRFYAGCDNVDAIEKEAVDLAKELFNADHAYVQPHSGADANLVAYLAVLYQKIEVSFLEKFKKKKVTDLTDDEWAELKNSYKNQKLLAMDLNSGGHLTHGYRFNISSKLFDVHTYSVNDETHELNLDDISKKLHEVKPLIFLAGYSAYSKKINFAKLKEMADEVGAVFMVDMAHFAGLVAGGVFSGDYNPVEYADIVTSTTHKTLRGPRGGLVLCKNWLKDAVNKGCPLVLGGPLPHIMAAKAVAFREALSPEFKDYAHKIVVNSKILADEFIKLGVSVSAGGTDNHIVRIDVYNKYGLTGLQAEGVLRDCGFTLNRNTLPGDKNGAWFTSGLRLGTAAVTTLGMGEKEIKEIAGIIDFVLKNTTPEEKNGKKLKSKYSISENIVKEAKNKTNKLLDAFPLYKEIDHKLLFSVL